MNIIYIFPYCTQPGVWRLRVSAGRPTCILGVYAAGLFTSVMLFWMVSVRLSGVSAHIMADVVLRHTPA